MQDESFRKIREAAKSDKTNLSKYVLEVRSRFKLSPYWDEILSWLLTYDGLVQSLPMTGGVIDTKRDPVTKKDYYSIPVYPETTDKNIKSSAKLIRKRYKERGEEIDLRNADDTKTEAEFMALALHEAGKSYDEIAKKLNYEFDESYITTEVPTLIHKALKKSLRQEKRS